MATYKKQAKKFSKSKSSKDAKDKDYSDLKGRSKGRVEVINRSADNTGKFCDFHESGPNDPRWYSLDDQLLFDSANVPYSWPLGNRLNLGQYGADLNNTAFPGIMAIYTMPTIGTPDDANAPVNTAMRNIYSFVRHANSGASNYEAPDLMLYLLAMDSAYSFLAWMKRVYGVIRTYNPENRYYPMATIASMNVDFDDIQRHLSDFRMYINVFATKIGSMCIPASMSYMAKHSWMYSGLYLDSVSSKAQTYLFNPYAFLYYDAYNAAGTGNDTRGVLKLMPMTDRGARLTREDIYNIGNALINPILASEDMNIMSGDILKAFGPENLVKVSEIDENYTVLPSYDMEVLDQIQNLTMVGDFVGEVPTGLPSSDPTTNVLNHIGAVVVDQATDLFTGYLVSNPKFCLGDAAQSSFSKPAGFNYMASNKPLTFQYDNVTTFNTMEASRMMSFINPPTSSIPVGKYANSVSTSNLTPLQRWVYDLYSAGSEVACFARIYFYGIGSAGTWTLLNTDKFYTAHGFEIGWPTSDDPTTATSIPYSPATIAGIFNDYNILLSKLTQFDRHPALVPVLRIGKSGTSPLPSVYSNMNGLVFDVDKYAIITPEIQENMNQTALLSQFNVRQYGKSGSITNVMV